MSTIDYFAARVTRSLAFAGFVRLLERFDAPRAEQLRVLTYHRVDEPQANPVLDPALISARPAAFERQMALLAARWRPVALEDVCAALDGGPALPLRAVLTTFDDAYRDFAEQAWPVLRKYGIPATQFVATAFPDCPTRGYWWDRLWHAFQSTHRRLALETPVGTLSLSTASDRQVAMKRLRRYLPSLPHASAMHLMDDLCRQLEVAPPGAAVLGWNDLRQLMRDGLTLGGHTHSHPLLNRVAPHEAELEIAASFDDLRRETGRSPAAFAYPGGATYPGAHQAVRSAGFSIAFGTGRGINQLDACDRLQLCRTHLSQGTTPLAFRAKLLPAFSKWKKPRRKLQPVLAIAKNSTVGCQPIAELAIDRNP